MNHPHVLGRNGMGCLLHPTCATTHTAPKPPFCETQPTLNYIPSQHFNMPKILSVYSASNRTSASWRDLLFQRNFGKKKACINCIARKLCQCAPSAVVWECGGEKSCVTPTRKGGEYSSLPQCTRTQNKIECCRRFYPGEFLIKKLNANEPD